MITDNVKKQSLRYFVIIVSLMLSAIAVEGAQDNLSAPKDESLRRGETRATLDPNFLRTHE